MSMLSAMDGSDRRNLNKATKKQKFSVLIFDYIAFCVRLHNFGACSACINDVSADAGL